MGKSSDSTVHLKFSYADTVPNVRCSVDLIKCLYMSTLALLSVILFVFVCYNMYFQYFLV